VKHKGADVARRSLFIALLAALQGCGRVEAGTGLRCRDASPPPMDAVQVARFLASTREMSKTYIDAARFDVAEGVLWRFTPPITVTFRQHWMVAPMTVSINAMKVRRNEGVPITLLRKTDETVLSLEGGDRGLLACN
jgi:hypothetical protein